MTRAERRHQQDTAKSKAARVLRQRKIIPNAAMIGKAAVMHNTCPCPLCTYKEPEYSRQILSDSRKLHANE
jgi:hypothetical protein